MSRRELVRRGAMGLGAVLCLVLAVMLGLIARDIVRYRDAVAAGDVRYRVSPNDPTLWLFDERAPFRLSEWTLAARDDVDFRQALRALRVSRLEEPTISDPDVAILRNEAQARLEAIVTTDGDQARRSRAAALLGVLGLARLVSETQERGALLSSTVANLQLAIALDPGNDEAKYNLELALQRGRGLQLTEGSGGANPTPGGSGAQGAGAGVPGSGY